MDALAWHHAEAVSGDPVLYVKETSARGAAFAGRALLTPNCNTASASSVLCDLGVAEP